MTPLVIGTAGHIDHGKTALVAALTGTDTDRLPEEKRRGITIDLGYAAWRLPGGRPAAIVDVPGHEGFVRNMLAGASGIDLGLLVIAADEGVMPQTREHIAILDLLGVRSGVVALTRADLVESEWLDLVRDDVERELAATGFATAPIVIVSARTGQGLDELGTTIERVASTAVPRDPDDLARLPIDRVFTVRGTGTVVTGTLWSGRVARDTTLRILPAGRGCRVRAVQVQGQERESAVAGERVALAIADLDRADARRGDVLVDSSVWQPATTMTARVSVLPDAAAPIRRRQRVRVHLGTMERMGRIVPLDTAAIAPGSAAWAQLRFEGPVVARAGDRFVIRAYSPVTTIAGGIVVEPTPPRRRAARPIDAEALAWMLDQSPQRRIAAAARLAGAQGLTVRTATLLAGVTAAELSSVVDGDERVHASIGITAHRDALFPADVIVAAEAAVCAALGRYHAEHPLRRGPSRELLRQTAARETRATAATEAAIQRLETAGRIAAAGPAIMLAGFEARLNAEQQRTARAILAALHEAGTRAPLRPELAAAIAGCRDSGEVLEFMERDGSVVAIGADRIILAEILDRAVATVRAALDERGPLGPADFRELFGISRKYLIPLLEHLDAAGITERQGDHRVLATPRRNIRSADSTPVPTTT